MVRSREEAMEAMLKQTRNEPGMCQKVTREWFGAPSAGDRDGDKDADALDGWKSEPENARHSDRDFPAGVPLAFRNADGSGHGHRAGSLPDGKIRSTDMDGDRYVKGTTSTVSSLEALEKAMGLVYLGWSETISGEKIPTKVEPPENPEVKKNKVEQSRDAMKATINRLEAAVAVANRKGHYAKAAELGASLKKQRQALRALPDQKVKNN